MTEKIIHDVSPPDFRVVTERERHLLQTVHQLNDLLAKQQQEIEWLREELADVRADAALLREEIKGTRMRIADLEKQLFRATGRTP